MRKGIILVWLLVLLSAIAMLFWYNEWKYSLQTPVPDEYKMVASGQKIILPENISTSVDKPVFLHFFNPKCPCSRFNLKHVRSLIKEYKDKADFAIVVMSDKEYTGKEVQDRFGLDIPVLFDSSIAAICGVYSTPQAVIIDKDQHLYYRGNYNRTRYCADRKTEYARMSLDSLLENKQEPVFDQYALKAYGCQLPKCSK